MRTILSGVTRIAFADERSGGINAGCLILAWIGRALIIFLKREGKKLRFLV